MGYGGYGGGFGAGGASTDVGMTSESGMSQAVPEQGSGAMPKEAPKGEAPSFKSGGGGETNFAKPDLPARDLRGGMREGYQRLAEVGERQRSYGTP